MKTEAKAEVLQSKEIPVSRSLIYSLRHPAKLANELGSSGRIKDVLEWHMPIKSRESHAANLIELAGGQQRSGELPEAAAVREAAEEINLRQLCSQPEFICQANYQIPDYQKQRENFIDYGHRQVSFIGLEMFTHDRPYPIDPIEAKIDRVVSLTSRQLITLIQTNQVEIQNERNQTEVLSGINYFQLIGPEARKSLIDYVVQKESQIGNQPRDQGLLDVKSLYIESAKRYLAPFANRGGAVFVPALIYATCGLGFKYKPESFDELIDLLPDNESVQVHRFFSILKQDSIATGAVSLVSMTEKSQFFSNLVEKDLRKTCILSGNLSLNDHLENVHRLIQTSTNALVVNGAVPGSDLTLSNETMNQSLYYLFEIFRKGTVYGLPVNDRIFHDAAKIIGFLYAFIRLEPDYLLAENRGNFEISRAMAEQFTLTNDMVQLGQVNAAVRKYHLPAIKTVTEEESETLAVIVDEVPRKDRVSFCRKVITREDSKNVSDLFRRSVIVVGYYDQKDQLILFEQDGHVDLDYNRLIAQQFSQSLRERLMKGYSLMWGDNNRQPRLMPDDNLAFKPKGEINIGSKADRFLWQKFYVFNTGIDPDFTIEENGSDENWEISELAIWATIGDYQMNGQEHYGYVYKKADDLLYGFWRMAMILGWFHPDTLSKDMVSQVVYRRQER